MADAARHQREPAGRQAERRRQRQRRADGDRGRRGVRRGDQRSPLPRVRREDRQGVVGDKLGATVNANPMTYQGKNGKQYVAAVATDTVVAFALP